MNQVYVCTHCNAIWHEEQLEDNEDGICEYCGHPLQLLEAEGDNFPYHCFNKEQVNGISQELNNMIKNVKTCGQDDTWHSIELLKNPLDRCQERKLFFQALKQLNKNFFLKGD